jgi:hypothetical protein
LIKCCKPWRRKTKWLRLKSMINLWVKLGWRLRDVNAKMRLKCDLFQWL